MELNYGHGGDIYSRNIEMDYSANINPLGLPRAVREALLEAVAGKSCEVYPDSRCGGLRQALSDFHGVKKDWIICGNGAAELIFGLASACGGKPGLVLAPAFSEYSQALSASGCGIQSFFLSEEGGFQVNTEQLSACIDGAKAAGVPYGVVFLCNPNNPTGLPLKKEQILRTAEACERAGSLLVVDECFCDFLENPEEYSVVPFLGQYPHLFVLKAFTKLYAMAGLRLGYGLCSNEPLLGRLYEGRQPWSVSGLAQKAGIAALSQKDYVRESKAVIKEERQYLAQELAKLGFRVYPGQANYLFFKDVLSEDALPENASSEDVSTKFDQMKASEKGWLYDALLDGGVLIRSCANYSGLDNTFYRICVKMRPENEAFLGRLKAVLKER